MVFANMRKLCRELVLEPLEDRVVLDAYVDPVYQSDITVVDALAAVNHEPIAYAQSITLVENQVSQITLTGDDGDPDVVQSLTFFLDSVPANGALYLSQADAQNGTNPLGVGASLTTGVLWYKSALNNDMDTSFMFHVKDDGGTANGGDDTSASALVTVTVAPDNQSPDAGNFSVVVNEDTAIKVTGWNFTDAEGNQGQSIRITDLPDHGILFIDANDNNVVDPGEAIGSDQLNGRVTFTFDDGYLNNYINAFPIMEEYGVEGVSLVVTGDIGQNAEAMTWSQLQEMQAAGWEIGSHSMTHPMLTELTDSQLVYELSESKNLLVQHGLTGTSFAYPYGDFDPRVVEYVMDYYEGCREAWGNNGINETPGNPYAIYNRSVDNTTTPQEVIQWINDAVANNYWLVISFHHIVTGTPGPYQYNVNNFETIVSYVASHNIATPTISEVLNNDLAPISWADATTKLKYIGSQDYYGQDSFQYVVIDSAGSEGTMPVDAGTTTVTVNPVNDDPINDEPIANPQSITLTENQVTQITLTGDDGDPDVTQTLTFFLDSLPANGALYLSQADAQSGTNPLGVGASLSTGVLWYKSGLNADADTSFMFHVKDNGGTANGGDDTSASALVTVTVTPDNQSPDAGNFSTVVNEDTAVNVTGWNFTDAEGNQAQSIRITDLPDHGTLFIDANDNNVVDPGEAISLQPNEGRVTFTFDDGYLDTYTNAFRIMDTYDVEGVSLVVTGDIGDAWAMTWSQLQQMQAAGWEIGSHSMTHPMLTGLTDSQLVYELSESKNLLDQYGLTGTSFAYPYGDFDPRVAEFVSRYYEDCREAWGNNGINEIPGNPYAIYNRSVDNTTTPQEVIQWINDAVANNYWLVISFHRIVDGTANPYEYNVNNFETIVSYVASHNIATPTISEVVNNDLAPISWADATTKLKYIGDQEYSGSDSFQYVVIDSAGSEGKMPADAGTAIVTVIAVNDAPVNSIPGPQTVNGGTDLLFSTANGNAISISDADAGTEAVRVQLTATHGTLTLSGTSGLSFTAGDGTTDATMTFTGSMTSINAALNGMHFTPTSNYSGDATVQIVTNDLGNNPSGEMSDSDTVNITVVSTSGPPVAGDFAVSVNEDAVTTVSQWTFTDPNGDSAQSIRITDLPDHGTLFLDANTNNILDANEAVSLNQVISWADAKTSPKVKYVGSQNYNGQDSLAYVVIDSSGEEGVAPDGDGTGSITVTAVNDAPVNAVPVAQTMNANTSLIFSTANGNVISISDVDAGTDSVRVQLTATNGNLTLSGIGGLSFSAGDGTADATMTFTGSVASINAALNGMSFTPTSNYSGAATVQIVTNDLGHNPSGEMSDSDTVNITVVSTSGPPVAGDFAVSVNEDIVATVSQWTFTDPNGDSAQSIRITDLPDHGTLFLDANTNNILDANEAVSLNQVISWADAKTSPKVKYVGSQNYNGQDSLTYVVIDSSGEEGVAPAGDGTGSITVAAVNDAPVNAIPAAQTMNANTSLIFSTANGNVISISDVDAGTDSISVQLTATNGNLTLAGTSGLSFTAGDGTADATMTFTGSVASINAALNGMHFTPTSNYSGAASVQIVTNDLGHNPSGEMSDSDTVNITVVSAGGPPVADDFTLSVKEDTVVTVSKWTFTDPDGNSAQSIRITDLPDHGTLFLDANANNILDTSEAISLNQVISWTDAKTTPKVKYVGSQNYNGQDSLAYVVIDSSGQEGIPSAGDGTGTITVTAVNDAPVNAVPGSQSINEDTVLTFSAANGNAISISDVDAGTEPVRVTLTATRGKLTLSGTTGLTFSTGDGTADTTMTFTGSIDDINAALNGMNFTPNANYAGAATVKIVTNDLGNNPSGAKSDTDTIAVTVNAIDDAPVNSVPGTQTVSAGQTLVFNNVNGNRIRVSDVDAGANQIEVTLTAANGTLTLYSLTGLTFSAGDGTNDESMTFRGTVSSINAAINRLRFIPTIAGSASLSITTNDLGASGSGGPLTDTDSIQINVT
ncbi:polysaccharide deacetylase family protein [Desulfomonile tiedjei]|uniref:Putative xylanase/chitin deacetylase n=1 Tax=Desulfomonile tiedjei (strain ATCC 49306 / DSM 6799 / DCB-1) TaxID=706587 RepID=I4CEV2_DESTA|nr:Ig-like domain-containing protein [Desulfomonile tiedjei]AFM28093.1 putative xylanase/chitin deacetylase [Desulfomonile tiedjei DSM 6799]